MSRADLRTEYQLRGLSENDLAADPIEQFGTWFDQALAAGVKEPNAMALATVAANGRPSVRMVLLKGFDATGFVFYTNYESRKGRELSANPWAAIAIHWVDLERQIRIEGRVERVSAEQSAAYFHSRPVASQLSAAASHQSEVIPNRMVLEKRVADLEAQFAAMLVPLPAEWGGYRLAPSVVEFWQGRPSRLHDRLRFRRGVDDAWVVERLAP
jgi:pyridoxamine 5'-phosphate oxidase